METRPAHEPALRSASSAVLAHWMGVADANFAGYVHGGTIMKLCDEAAGLAAVRHSHTRVVTAGVDRMTFLFPIEIGQLVTFQAAVNAVWRTSMEIGVRVDAEHPRTGEVRHTNTAYFTMVAVDADGRPTGVPELDITTPEATRRAQEAQLRRANRLEEREAVLRARAAEGELT
jgi:acyl-CoA hydrolase